MTITALDADRNVLYRQTYYSIGGGFIVDEAHFGQEEENPVTVPYPYQHAEDILKHCQESGLMLSTVMMKNELSIGRDKKRLKHIYRMLETNERLY